jgi:hypothetical protein
MTLIIVQNKKVLSMTDLMRAVLKYIYAPEEMKADEIRTMKQSIVTWQKHFEYKKEQAFYANKKSTITDDLPKEMCAPVEMSVVDQELENTLQDLAVLLRANQEGKLEGRKQLFRQHAIDYRKFHQLPEAYKPEDFARGAYHLEQHKKENPEYYASEKNLSKGKIITNEPRGET